VVNTLIPLSRELWPMIDSVMPSCCLRMTAAVELATHYTTPCRHRSRYSYYECDSGSLWYSNLQMCTTNIIVLKNYIFIISIQ